MQILEGLKTGNLSHSIIIIVVVVVAIIVIVVIVSASVVVVFVVFASVTTTYCALITVTIWSFIFLLSLKRFQIVIHITFFISVLSLSDVGGRPLIEHRLCDPRTETTLGKH